MKINNAKYEGYLWWSNSKTPVIYDGTQEIALTIDETQNPFIVEGNFWDKELEISIFIKYVDGEYLVRKTEVAGLTGPDYVYTDVVYAAHRLPSVCGLRFRQYWKAEKDDLCAGLAAMQPDKLVFVGFEKTSQKK